MPQSVCRISCFVVCRPQAPRSIDRHFPLISGRLAGRRRFRVLFLPMLAQSSSSDTALHGEHDNKCLPSEPNACLLVSGCSLCGGAAAEPSMADPCGHVFCSPCLRAWLATVADRHCPVCDIYLCGALPNVAPAVQCSECTFACALDDQQTMAAHFDTQHLLVSCNTRVLYRKYHNAAKAAYVRFAEQYNATHGSGGAAAASRHFARPYADVPPSTIRSWMEGKGNHGLAGYERQRASSDNMLALGPAREEQIAQDIKDTRKQGLPVSSGDVARMARIGAPSGFVASPHWVRDFLDRHHMSRRTISLRKAVKPEGVRVEDAIRDCWNLVESIRRHHGIPEKRILNLDEKRQRFEMHPSQTVDTKGISRSIVIGDGKEKVGCTVTLCAGPLRKYQPLITFASHAKIPSSKRLGVVVPDEYRDKVLITATKSSWLDHNSYWENCLKPVLAVFATGNERAFTRFRWAGNCSA